MSTSPEELTRTFSPRYRIERELGRGGMATVYLADDLKHGRKVAIKVLDRERAVAIGQERFLREIEIAARLTHPHILALHDSGAAGDQLYYVMPYIAGGSLRTWLEREKQLPLEDALRLAREIASALGHAHHEGLVHRDIKPENVLISEGVALVADFGIARALSAAAADRLTTAGGMIGTPRYMAPEQAMGRVDVDGRADLYALGCVLYEMLAGQPPFTGPDEGLVYQHLSVEPRPVTDLRPAVPRPLAAVISRSLAKLPSDRYASAARFAEALASATIGVETPTPQPGPEGGAIPQNLPRQRTHFIGRERELAECARALGDTRVLTITGIGGCGKTRLGLRLAETLLETFPDGVWYADLAPLKDAERVALTLATALELREEPGTPLLETLAHRLRDRRALIVLDNCEHVLAPAAELADALIAASGDLKMIVTSREGLGIEGERLFALRSLSVPAAVSDLRAVESSEAVRLFVDRAQVLDSRFTLTPATAPAVADICRRLDGIPLAIELAAARIKVLKVEDIAKRLDDRFRLLTGGSKTALPRHQTLRATIQWSYDQLAPEEQRLFRLLSVFSGGWTLDAATRIAGEDADEFAVLELMTRLVDKSLVTMDREAEGDSRYSMLETVRQYAMERLNEAGEGDGARTRHLDFYLRLAEEAEPHMSGREQAKWVSRLFQERENLLAAHAWCERSPDHVEEGLRLVGSLRRFWLFFGLSELGRRVSLEAVARPGAQARTWMRGKALINLSISEFFLARYDEARVHGEESLAISREVGRDDLVCDALRAVGLACTGQKDYAAGKTRFHELVALARRRGDRFRLSIGLNSLAEIHRMESDLDAAEPLYEETLALQRESGDRDNIAIGLLNVAVVAIARGADGRARERLRESVSTVNPQSVRTVANLLGSVAAWSAGQEAFARAARLFGASDAQFARTGTVPEPADEAFIAPRIARVREALGEAAFEAARAAGAALGSGEALAEAREALEAGAD